MSQSSVTAAPLAGLLMFAATLLGISEAHALDTQTFDPWLRPQDSFELRLDSRYGSASKQYDENGSSITLLAPDAPGSVNWFDLRLSAEYGLFEDLTIELGGLFRRTQVAGPSSTATVTGIGDLDVGIAYNLLRTAVDLSVAVDTHWPTGYAASPGGFVPSLGDGAPTADLLAIAGRRYEAPFEFSLAAGYRLRGNRVDSPVGSTNLRDQLVLQFAATFDPREEVRIELGIDGALAFYRPKPFDELELRPEAHDYLNGALMISTPVQERFRAGIGYQRTFIGLGALVGQSLLVSVSLEETL